MIIKQIVTSGKFRQRFQKSEVDSQKLLQKSPSIDRRAQASLSNMKKKKDQISAASYSHEIDQIGPPRSLRSIAKRNKLKARNKRQQVKVENAFFTY